MGLRVAPQQGTCRALRAALGSLVLPQPAVPGHYAAWA